MKKNIGRLNVPVVRLDGSVGTEIKGNPMAFQVGYNKKVTWTTAAGLVFPGQSGLSSSGGTATINVTEHSWSEMIDKLDVTHSGSAGIQALLAGILRGDGNVKANCDDAQIITSITSSIVAGINGIMSFFLYAVSSNAYVVPAMIQKVNFKSVVSGVASYDFDVSLNGLAGAMVRPA